MVQAGLFDERERKCVSWRDIAVHFGAVSGLLKDDYKAAGFRPHISISRLLDGLYKCGRIPYYYRRVRVFEPARSLIHLKTGSLIHERLFLSERFVKEPDTAVQWEIAGIIFGGIPDAYEPRARRLWSAKTGEYKASKAPDEREIMQMALEAWLMGKNQRPVEKGRLLRVARDDWAEHEVNIPRLEDGRVAKLIVDHLAREGELQGEPTADWKLPACCYCSYLTVCPRGWQEFSGMDEIARQKCKLACVEGALPVTIEQLRQTALKMFPQPTKAEKFQESTDAIRDEHLTPKPSPVDALIGMCSLHPTMGHHPNSAACKELLSAAKRGDPRGPEAV